MGNRAYLNVFIKKEKFEKEFIELHYRAKELERLLRLNSKEKMKRMLSDFSKDANKYGYNVENMIYFSSHIMQLLVPLEFLIFEGEEYISNSYIKGEYSNAGKENKNFVPLEWASVFRKEDVQPFERIIIDDISYDVRSKDYVTTIKQALLNIKGTDNSLKEWLEIFPEDSLLTLNYRELILNESFDEDSFIKYMKVS